MIKAVIFDLDGTLVQTEILKAQSYARAFWQLSDGRIGESEVIEAFASVVGRSRQEVAVFLLEQFSLEEEAGKLMPDFGVATPWQALIQIRLQVYQQMLETPDILLKHRCPYNMALLRKVRKERYSTGLATMSHCAQARQVLGVLEIKDLFDFIATRDDVETGKPDPEIYLLVASQLNVEPNACLVIEDSLSGIQAGLSAGMKCIAVTNKFSTKTVYESKILDKRWIVDDPRNLLKVAEQRIAEMK